MKDPADAAPTLLTIGLALLAPFFVTLKATLSEFLRACPACPSPALTGAGRS